ncbi:MAG: polyprenyl synthetase family protein [Planctomycetes bacterium]|nr:polyprenyl synthetase family protein [Planctomycetota bacterium]
MTDLERFLEASRASVDAALGATLPSETEPPEVVHRAMRYAVLGAGKRIRPALAFATGRALGVRTPMTERRFTTFAAAIECIHACSLVLDDLPCMDDATLRRGRDTCHRVFGEAHAILAADALLMLGFDLVAQAGDAAAIGRRDLVELIRLAAQTVGSSGMIGGQSLDLVTRGAADLGSTERIHRQKTGVLFQFATRGTAILCKANDAETAALSAYAKNVGLAFQITDDLLDFEGTTAKTGKDVGRDAAKPNFVALCGAAQAHAIVHELLSTAKASLAIFDSRARILHDIADRVEARES